jgi:hypothetical protein
MFDWMSRVRLAVAVLLGVGILAAPGGALARTALDEAEAASASSTAEGVRREEQSAADARANATRTPNCRKNINARAQKLSPKVRERVKAAGPIELEVRETDPVLNFGDSRGTLYDYVVLKASQQIPLGVNYTHFELDSLEPMRRIGGEGLESARLLAPTYSRPHFFNHRMEIGFNLCVTAASGDPGTYTGQFLFVGPGEVASVPISQTAQLKTEEWKFLIALLIVLLATLGFLGVKALAEFDGEAEPREVVVKGTLLFISVAAAGLAMYLVYDKTPTWGDDLVVDGAALIATAFTAAGLGNTLAAGTGKISESLDRAKKSRKSLQTGSSQDSTTGTGGAE